MKGNVPVSSSGIDTIAGHESHFQMKDRPNEKGTSQKQVRGHIASSASTCGRRGYE
ncbi:hypothetical protein V8E51_016051 [Hyaloscypha variabilis]